jgi:hypothetical protein
MKYRLVNLGLCAFLSFVPVGAFAQSGYETPEYSGPAARLDSGADRYRDQENAVRASRQRLDAIRRDRRNDLAVDRQNERRTLRVQDEMQRKREESLRVNRQYILKTNQ